MSMPDVLDLVEQSRDILDDVWRQTDFEPYPETRMVRLMDVIGRKGIFSLLLRNAVQFFQEPLSLHKHCLSITNCLSCFCGLVNQVVTSEDMCRGS